MPELTVGPGQQYATIAAALAASRDGDVIAVRSGTYTNDFAHITTDVTLRAVDGMVSLVATVAPPDGKAIFTTDANVTIEGFEFSGARVPDGNGAGIRQQTGDLTVSNSYFHDNENGILTAHDTGSTVTIRDSEFERNGNGLGNTHGIYVGHIGKLVVERSFFHDTLEGHQLKSRAIENVITDSRFYDDDGTGSYSIDLPNGGIATLSGNVLQQGPNGHNPVILAYGEEGSIIPGSRLTMTDTVIVNDRSGGTAIWNAAGAPASATGTEVFGLASGQMANGPVTLSDTTYLAMRPEIDQSSPWSADPPTEPPVVPPDPEPEPAPGDLVATDGQDVFSFAPGDGYDGGPFVIRGFALGQDRIVAPDDTRFPGVTYETWASTGALGSETGTWVQWSWGDAERVFVAGVDASLERLTGATTEPPAEPEPEPEPPVGQGDTYRFGPGDGYANGGPFVIRDFDVGLDRVLAQDDTRFAESGLVYEAWAAPGAYLNETGTWVQWSWGDEERVFLAGVEASLAEIEGGTQAQSGAAADHLIA